MNLVCYCFIYSKKGIHYYDRQLTQKYNGIVRVYSDIGYLISEYEVKNGIEDGLEKNYIREHITDIRGMRQEITYGLSLEFYWDGRLKSNGINHYNLLMDYTEYDEEGNVIYEDIEDVGDLDNNIRAKKRQETR